MQRNAEAKRREVQPHGGLRRVPDPPEGRGADQWIESLLKWMPTALLVGSFGAGPRCTIANCAEPPGAPPQAPGVHLAIEFSPTPAWPCGGGPRVQEAPWSSEYMAPLSVGRIRRVLLGSEAL